MNKWLFNQNGFTRTRLSATVTRVSNFVEENVCVLVMGRQAGMQAGQQTGRQILLLKFTVLAINTTYMYFLCIDLFGAFDLGTKYEMAKIRKRYNQLPP